MESWKLFPGHIKKIAQGRLSGWYSECAGFCPAPYRNRCLEWRDIQSPVILRWAISYFITLALTPSFVILTGFIMPVASKYILSIQTTL